MVLKFLALLAVFWDPEFRVEQELNMFVLMLKIVESKDEGCCP